MKPPKTGPIRGFTHYTRSKCPSDAKKQTVTDADGRTYVLTSMRRAGAQAEVWNAITDDPSRDAVVVRIQSGQRSDRSVMLAGILRTGWMRPLALGTTGDGRAFTVYERASGGDLQELVEREGKLPAGRAVEITIALADAVAQAHAAGVYHRDIKPDNAVLTERGPALIDLGLGTGAGDTDETGPGRAPGYAAPESLRGEPSDLPGAADIYGLGAVLFYLLTGHAPNGTTPEDCLARLTPGSDETNRRIRLEQLERAKVPDAFATITLDALSPSPADRPVQASAFAASLRAAAPKTSHRTKLHRLGFAAAVLVPIGLLAFAMWTAGHASATRDADQQLAKHQAHAETVKQQLEAVIAERDTEIAQRDTTIGELATINGEFTFYYRMFESRYRRQRWSYGKFHTTDNFPRILYILEHLNHPGLFTGEISKIDQLLQDRLYNTDRHLEAARGEGTEDAIFNLLLELTYAGWLYQDGEAAFAAEVLNKLIPRLEQKLEPFDEYLIGAREMLHYAEISATGEVPDELPGGRSWVLRLVSNQVRLRDIDYPNWAEPPAPAWAGIPPYQIAPIRRLRDEFTEERVERARQVEQARFEKHPAITDGMTTTEAWRALEAYRAEHESDAGAEAPGITIGDTNETEPPLSPPKE